MKVWITKYALTQGIFEVVGEVSDTHPTMFVDGIEYYHKPHWHETREKALERADIMRTNKICSLKKQLIKLEAMTFE